MSPWEVINKFSTMLAKPVSGLVNKVSADGVQHGGVPALKLSLIRLHLSEHRRIMIEG